MNKEFIPKEQSLDLKELGFDEPCFATYRQWDGREPYLHLDTDIEADNFTIECDSPLYQQAFKWFREKYKLVSYIRENEKNNFGYEWVIEGDDFGGETESRKGWTYEEAELECLKKLIEIVKTK